MGIWDKLKGIFGSQPQMPAPSAGGAPGAGAPSSSSTSTQTFASTQTPTPSTSTSTSTPTPPPANGKNPYQSDILGLSQEEMRKRALKIDPYRTAWIGRTDTIPPQSDERTAIIDRGLMLRGFLTKAQ